MDTVQNCIQFEQPLIPAENIGSIAMRLTQTAGAIHLPGSVPTAGRIVFTVRPQYKIDNANILAGIQE